MSTSASPLHSAAQLQNPHVQVSASSSRVPWYIWCGVLAITSSSIGGSWDVSWHRSIGRDAFLTAPHLAIYACGVLAAVICGFLIFATTFGGSPELKAQSVNVLGFRAPLGAFIAAWGGIAMLTSAPFDNWWHAAYGLDVKIVSPPHTLLILGVRSVAVGVLFLILAAMNRAESPAGEAENHTHATLRRLLLYVGGLAIMGQMFFLQEYTWDVMLHRTSAYIAMGIALPVLFALLSQASGYRWTATVTAATYMLFAIGEILILPLFPATPKLGPVFTPVTHFVPAKFPVLLLIPALALDIFWHRVREWKPWKVALASGFLFMAVLVVVEWPFANFLMSKASQNRFFGTMYFQYSSRPGGYERMRKFFEPESGLALIRGLLFAAIYGSFGTWVGLRFGRWMKGIQR